MMDTRKSGGEIDVQAVRAHLQRIVESETFVRSPRLRRFLEFIVEETLAGRSNELGEYAIGVAVCDRGTDFEPMLDPIVRNDARRLRFKLHEYYRENRADSAGGVAIEIPKGAYVPVFSAVATDGAGPRGFAAENISRRAVASAVPDDARRLAVAPFEVLSDAPECALAGRALCLSLTAGISNVRGVEAVAHGFLGPLTSREAAHGMGLSHVIQGCVFQTGGRCRVIVNLTCANNGVQLWAREYDFETPELFTFQSEVTREVTHEVALQLGAAHAKPVLLQRRVA